ncbi:MAG: hypothetical protein EWV55_18605 [Microcystis viridis Mv_BB_P_19951000_S69]|uniref:Uncharacterized protein n=1 Tax=Microcystis viridis Mv_BB_P_19951000_S68D TaxID=2486270 RepID=A0A552HKW0_MICVR|nr:MAG: hypothetical protein EWV47_23625 [Microcystis viridis Mv_BB_P_19951000_S68]TRU70725.1 MAG: hypothetical protein EWV55_18605 [Microcystis viridis Mv_BB_P_19951000_S69]TRU71873.1 MAG: hypothetical protein EWV77_14595 [Microcystis viridis Mv_BB_P_19951000_S68D]TRU81125.1 MAG: hypothetical protein EWV46_21700 [Microcystis viridis Mv_BB_P_19951000_S69D]
MWDIFVKTFPEKRSIVSLEVYNLSKASIEPQSSQYCQKKESGFQEQMLWLLLQRKKKLSATTLIFVNNVTQNFQSSLYSS